MLLHPKLPDQNQVRKIFKEIESQDERLELNLYIVGGEGDAMKLAYWPGCVSRGFTPSFTARWSWWRPSSISSWSSSTARTAAAPA